MTVDQEIPTEVMASIVGPIRRFRWVSERFRIGDLDCSSLRNHSHQVAGTVSGAVTTAGMLENSSPSWGKQQGGVTLRRGD